MGVKKESGQISFNLSPSSLNVYYQSPLLFYLTYIAKVPDDTFVPICYGLSGNIVHDCLEKYANGEFERDGAYLHLVNKWESARLDVHKDVKGEALNKMDYLMAMIKGIEVVDKHESRICEEKISFPLMESEDFKIGIKGIIDLRAIRKEDGKQVVIDYKTSNSVNSGKDFERQALFYNLLIHKQHGILPSETIFHYLKLGVAKSYVFNEENFKIFEEELVRIAKELIEKGTDIRKYEIGNVEGLFNSKKKACLAEIKRRENGDLFSERISEGYLRY